MRYQSLICDISNIAGSQVVLCDNSISRDAHRELFSLEMEKYVLCSFSPVRCITSIKPAITTIHVALMWEGVLKVALWKDLISTSEVIYMLKHVGLKDRELAHFRNSDVNDIFPFLYYGNNFDVLRRICNVAKKIAEEKLRESKRKVICHMVSEDTKRIIASSL